MLCLMAKQLFMGQIVSDLSLLQELLMARRCQNTTLNELRHVRLYEKVMLPLRISVPPM